jgi:hypothetical protein
MKIAQWQPGEVIWDKCLESTIGSTVGSKIAERREIRQNGNYAQRGGADKACGLVRHLHAKEAQYYKGEGGQQKNQK